MSENAVTIRTRKFLSNPLLSRRQCIIDIHHPGRANVSKAELQEKLAKTFKAADKNAVILSDLRTQMGGGKTTGFCHIYDSVECAIKYHGMKHHLWRSGVIEKPNTKGRKGIKEAKNRGKKVRGLGRRIARKKARRSE
mmetsp:Transcript_17360/g.19767  ORF Transcript_17360/g.19767 Transcript_17360/m.19767 type:complete len:138 (-) Transcript_17360:670-1083(-)